MYVSLLNRHTIGFREREKKNHVRSSSQIKDQHIGSTAHISYSYCE